MSKQQLKLSVKNRDGIGRGPARRLRKAGLIPGIIYGVAKGAREAAKRGTSAVSTKPVSIDAVELRALLRAKGTDAALVELTLEDGAKTLSLIRDYQRDPLSLKIVHLDLQSVEPDAEFTVLVPVRFTGEPVGVKLENGTLDIMLHEVAVRCLPKDLPGSITVDVTNLHVNQSIHVGALPKIEGVTYPGDPLRAVVVCTAQEEEKAAETPAGGAAAATPAAGAAAAPAAAATAAAPAADAKKGDAKK
ncbi:MAG: 50S ribosomal protein L25 [Puniceicoccales bacterium]|jgi:large subunit ribosomal protein L25|nr:50S ribosomal protein L25 [Puniceicoccales bacterium]